MKFGSAPFVATLCAATLLLAAAPPAAAQGQPITARSSVVGLDVQGLRPGLTTASNGSALITVYGPPGSTYLLFLDTPPIGVNLDISFFFAGLLGPVALTGPVLIGAGQVVDPTGAALFTIPASGSQTLNLTAPIPAGAAIARFWALVTVPGGVLRSTNTVIRTLLGPAGSGAYGQGAVIQPPGACPMQDIEQADVDGDGDLDTLLVSGRSGLPDLILETGYTELGSTPIPLPLPAGMGCPTSAEFADFDNDGSVDLVIVGPGQTTPNYTFVAIYRNLGGPAPAWLGFQLLPVTTVVRSNPAPVAGFANPNDVETADVDLDGRIDIAMGCGLNPLLGEQSYLLLNTSATAPGSSPTVISFQDVTPQNLRAMTVDCEDIEFQDLDLDGDLDLVFGIYDGPPTLPCGTLPISPGTGVDFVMLNQGFLQGGTPGRFAEPCPRPIPALPDETRDVVLLDFDLDTRPDIYVTNWQQTVPSGVFTGAPVQDRLLRCVSLNPLRYADVSFLLPDNPAYTGPSPTPVSFGMDAEAFDFDQDGDPDVIVALGSFGNPLVPVLVPGLSSGAVFLTNTVPAGGPFNRTALGARNADFFDMEPGDWQFGPGFPGFQNFSWFLEDLGCATLNLGYFFLGKRP